VLARTFVRVVFVVFGALAASLATAGSADLPIEADAQADVSASKPTHAAAVESDGAIFSPFVEAHPSSPERGAATSYRNVDGAHWTFSIFAASIALIAVAYCLRLAWD